MVEAASMQHMVSDDVFRRADDSLLKVTNDDVRIRSISQLLTAVYNRAEQFFILGLRLSNEQGVDARHVRRTKRRTDYV